MGKHIFIKDIHENNMEYLEATYKNACELIEKYKWTEITCVKDGSLRTIDDIHEEIYSKCDL